MFRELRRKEKQLTIEECHRVLTKAEYGTLATMGADGYPYAVSVNYVFLNGNIYFHSAKDGHKLDNIAFCLNVSFNVVTDVWVEPLIRDEKDDKHDSIFGGFNTNFNSVIVFGEAKEVNDTEKRDGLHALLNKFLDLKDLRQYEDEGVKYIKNSLNITKLIKIEIKHISGKRGIRKNLKIQGTQH